MLLERIIGAFTFRKEVYAEVEKDTEFTSTAWMLVAVISCLVQLGQFPGYGFGGIGAWLIASVIRVVFSIGGFALGAFVVSWLGKKMFQAETDFDEMVRVLGLAYVWNVVGVLGIVGIIPGLACILGPALLVLGIVAWVAGLVSWLFAAKEALDLDWGSTAIVVVIAWAIGMALAGIAALIVSVLGFGAAAAASALQGG